MAYAYHARAEVVYPAYLSEQERRTYDSLTFNEKDIAKDLNQDQMIFFLRKKQQNPAYSLNDLFDDLTQQRQPPRGESIGNDNETRRIIELLYEENKSPHTILTSITNKSVDPVLGRTISLQKFHQVLNHIQWKGGKSRRRKSRRRRKTRRL